jgi:hypothetical protein
MKMQIHEHKIEESTLHACINRMKSAPFKAADIALVAEQNGVPHEPAYRVADRLIQMLRKKKNIKVGAPYPTWTWVA